MFNQFEDLQKFNKDGIDLAVKSFGSTTKNVQAIATETADYSKKAFEIQSDFAKSAYEGFVAYASKLGELYTDIAKDSVKPYEAMISKVQAAAK